MPKFIQSYVLLFLLFLLSGYGLYSSYNRGSANALYYKAEFVLNDWAAVGKIKNKQQYLETLKAITKAQALDPQHPHYAHIVGRIKHWGVNNGYELKGILPEVKSWYLKSTELRPLWPDPWVDLARLNNYMEGYNRETKGYMKKALETGPYIALVTSGVLKVLLYNWDILSNEDKALVFKQFDIATKQPELLGKILIFANNINRGKLLCLQLQFKAEYKAVKDSSIYRKHCS